ncbi:hypothetical protein J3F83DRAFT_727094 [Trichoderma novae-zelandiae]
MTRLVPYIIAFAAALVGFFFYQSKTLISTTKHPHDLVIYINPPSYAQMEEERFRVRFSAGPGSTVRGWPTKGGVYLLEGCLGIELDFLKLDRFHDTPRPSPSTPDAAAEEEAHCNRMRQLGAIWWENEEEWFMRKLSEPYKPASSRARRYIKVGWPAGGGVWVLDIKEDDAITRGAGIIYNAHDMEERCRMIEQLGGVFYKNPKDWLDVELP